jgi:RNA polymerase sigma-70 factor (ECF subfamily)
VDAARHGDSDAFISLYDEYADRMRGLAYRTLGDAALLDDAMQEVAVRAFRGLPGFRGDSSVGTWLYQITFRTCLNMLRGRDRTVAVPDVGALQSGQAPDPAEEVVRRLELDAALAALPPGHRAVVFLVLEQELDYRAAGRVLGIPPGTVASRLSAARSALVRCLCEGSDRRGVS